MNIRPLNPPERPAAAPVPARALPIGTRLRGEFDIIGVVHDGRYGLSYLAADTVQRRHVVIKEYLPAMLAARAPNYSPEVVLQASPHAAAFKEGLKAFIHEARLLVAFDTPGLVSVLRLWKQNGTAYMVLERIEGQSLRHVIADRGGAPDETELRGWLNPLLDTLATLHASRCVHGNITPDNLMIGPDGPVLLGFGGGRHAIAKALREPNDALEPGYAAVEQYGNDPAAAQGPWTDLYALASVVYATLTGRAPMAAPERRMSDPLVPLRELVDGRFSAPLIEAVDAALALWPGERPQDVAAFRALLDRERQVPVEAPPAPRPRAATAPAVPAAVGSAAAAAAAGAPAAAVLARSASPAPSPAAPVSNRAIAMLVLATAVCTIAFGVLGYFAMRPSDGLALPPSNPKSTAPLDLPPTSAGPPLASAVAVEPAPEASPAPPTAAAPAPAPASAPALAPVPPPTTATAPAPDQALASAQAPSPPQAPPARRARATAATPPAPSTATRARCSDLLQRASLEPLTRADAAILKKECR
ncbi:MAG TPA: protein kinase [Burkholderiaceae bacterium]|jgi:hypothetical protein